MAHIAFIARECSYLARCVHRTICGEPLVFGQFGAFCLAGVVVAGVPAAASVLDNRAFQPRAIIANAVAVAVVVVVLVFVLCPYRLVTTI